MRDTLYHILTSVLDLFLWGGKLTGEKNLPKEGPAVFIANHLDATGPIACCCSIPMRLYPWSVGDMMDPDKAPVYLNMDFTEKTLRLKPPLSQLFSHLLSHITVPLFWTLGCIPVYKGNYERMKETISLSMDILRLKKFILIFPEDPLMEADDTTGMKPFQHTFVRLGEMYHHETGNRLPFHPLTIHQKGIIHAGVPAVYDPLNKPGAERQRIKTIMEEEIRKMYIQLGGLQKETGVLSTESE